VPRTRLAFFARGVAPGHWESSLLNCFDRRALLRAGNARALATTASRSIFHQFGAAR